MAWNRSNSGEAESLPLQQKGGSSSFLKRKGFRFPVRGAVAGAIVVLGAAIAAWLLRPSPDSHPSSLVPHPSKTIREVTPAAAPTNRVKAVGSIGHPPETREEKLAWFRRKYGDNIPENLKPTVYFLENPPTHTYRPPPRREDIFRHHSERTIAAVLLLRPGAFVMQRVAFDEKFDHDFRKSLEEPTLLSKDDTPEERELKTAVNEVKAELSERMRNGEKPSEIMTKAMDDAYELGKYAENMESLVREMRDDPSKTDAEYEDFVKAANKMLKEKGANEIQMPTIVRRQTRLRMLSRKSGEKSDPVTKEKK